MARDLNRSIKIYIDNSDAMKKSEALKEKIHKLQTELEQLAAAGKKDTDDYARKEKALKQLHEAQKRYIDKIQETERVLNNLSGATRKQLEDVRSQLRRELKNTARGTEEYTAKLKALIAVEKELSKVTAEMKSEVGSQASMWSRAADRFNKYFGIVTSIIAGITGVSFTLRKLAEDNAKMDDVYSDVMKTTGMLRDQVIDLNVEFKKMDTRTAREELNNLARDAGKLGITGKKDILDFVEAANQIDVALGEDLGEGAIKNIGKINDVFKRSTTELNKLDLKGQMLSIGSAINELGASSTASEAYMVSFTQRLGGVASQAGISVQSILGYASALDQSGQAVEMSATALQKFIMTLMGDPAKFAKIAGLEIKEFNKLIKTDTNAAIKEVLSALSNKGGFQALIPIFKEMGLDGARAVGVLSALATNIDKVNEAQDIANDSFAKATSITDEYSVKNNNLQAQLEKQRKAFNDAALELGERLNPALLKSTNATTYFIKLLPSVLDFFEKYGKVIIALATAIGVYTGVVKLVTLAQAKWTIVDTIHYRLLQAKTVLVSTYRSGLLLLNVVINLITGNTLRAAAAWRMLGASMQANIIGIVITAVVALGYAIYELNKKTKDYFTSAKALNDINKDVAKSTASERAELNLLLTVARNEKISKEERLKAIKRLNEISPEYLGNLTLENINTKEATKSVGEYTKALLQNAKAKSIEGKVTELTEQINEKLITMKELEKEADKMEADWNDGRFGNRRQKWDKEAVVERVAIIRYQKEVKDLESKIQVYTSLYEDNLDQKEQGLINELQYQRSLLKQFEEEHAQAYERINKTKDKNNPFAYSQADEARDKIQLNLLGDKLNAQRKLVQEQEAEFANNATSKKVVLEDETAPVDPNDKGGANKALQKQKEALSLMLEDIETKHQQRMFSIKKEYNEGSIETESEFNQKIFAQEQAYYLIREQALIEYEKTVTDKQLKSDINKQISDIQNKRIDQEIKYQARIEQILLDANPEAKELKDYENRLRDAGLYAVERENLTAQQLEALEFLEQQHNDNLVRIRRDARKKAKTAGDEDFNEDFADRKEELLQKIAEEEQRLSLLNGLGALSGNESFNAEVALQQKRIALIQEEVDARKKAGLDVSKILKEQRAQELKMTQLFVGEYNKRRQEFDQYATNIGATVGNLIIGQENALQAFGDTMIDLMFDVLSQIINTKLAEATAVALAEQAKAAAIAYAMPDSVVTFGASGAARSAAIGALIMGGLAIAKSALKGMLNKGRSSSSSSSSTAENTSNAHMTVKQRASGKYDVIGQDDGQLYQNVPFAGPAKTGMVYRPTLVGEQGAELVVSSPDMRALQRHINYPMVVKAINEARTGRVPQRAEGKYDSLATPNPTPSVDPVQVRMLELLEKLNTNGVQATTYLGVTELQAQINKKNKEDNRFSKK